ncbi:MAG: cell wall-active antibiotics response protein [Thermoflavifilum sp.]|nr:cell wall-active antibiotics response protein [Thermoflavifilum sp.]
MNEKSGTETWGQRDEHAPSRGKWGGLIIFLTGLFLLLQQLHLPIPYWVVSWPMYLLIIGLLLLLISRYNSKIGIIFMLVGALFLVRDIWGLPTSFTPYIWPVLIMVIGLMLIFRPKKHGARCAYRRSWHMVGEADQSELSSTVSNDGWVETTAVFCGTRRKVISKNFKGGEVISVFGGVEMDFTQADVQGKAVLDVSVVFGGMRLFVPACWDVQVNITNVMGGVDDRRELMGIAPDPNKILSLTGAVVMGGVEIRSFPT